MNPAELPVWKAMNSLLDAVRRGSNIVLTAPPGSGKTTQVPQALLDNNLIKGSIVVVQPRRVACRAAARRIAEERETAPGKEVGYIVRHDGKTSSETRILFVTDGVLLRFLEKDPDLSWAGAVLFDEFHERRALTDIALGILRKAQGRRKSLRLIAMSATMEPDRVARYLDATKISAEGRSFPVEVRYAPCETLQDALDSIPSRLRTIHLSKDEGDILVFLPGRGEIEYLQRKIAERKIPGLVVLPLHGELTREAQDKVFASVNGRKVILATNIAETSVTIPGVRTVIDTGFERRADFDQGLGINRLALMRISRASAEQRSGRGGREAPGLCIRLWSLEQHKKLIGYAPVEMQRTDLASVIMSLKSLDVLDTRSFNFLDSPEAERMELAEKSLVQLGAVDTDRRLTTIGWRMLRLPLPPRYARMVVESERSGCLKEVASIAALMAGRPILAAPEGGKRGDAKINFSRDDSSDFFALLSVFYVSSLHRWSREWCEKHGVNWDALFEAIHLRRKIIHVAFSRGTPQTYHRGDRATIRRCILSGLVDRVAQQEKGRSYRLSNGLPCALEASTVVTGKLLVAADVRIARKSHGEDTEETAMLGFITRIEASMLEQIAPHLFNKVRVPTAFDAKSGSLTVREETRYAELAIESRETQVDLLEAFEVIAEQRARAKHNGWRRVEVAPGIGRASYVTWKGQKVRVNAEMAGPHWATVVDGNPTHIILKERIVVVPGTEEGPPLKNTKPPAAPSLPQKLEERTERLSSALSKLLGR